MAKLYGKHMETSEKIKKIWQNIGKIGFKHQNHPTKIKDYASKAEDRKTDSEIREIR